MLPLDLPFDFQFPLSGIVSLIINWAVITISLVLANYAISHQIDIKKIPIMGIVAYVLSPIFTSILNPFVPLEVSYILPLILWIILGEFMLKEEMDLKKRALIAVLGYIIFISLSYLNIQMFLAMMLRA